MINETDVVVAASLPPSQPVSWGAIIAGGVVASVATLVLMLVGSGLGFTMVSPWISQSASAATLVVSSAIWIVIVQWASSCLGGYMAGRLRSRWSSTSSDEATFRDSAHGLLAWCIGTLVVVVVLTYATLGALGAGSRAVSNVAGGAVTAGAQATSGMPANEYFVDSLFRSDDPARISAPGAEGDAAAVGQATRILAKSIPAGEISADDKNYLTTLVAARTGLSQADAQKRIDDVWASVQSAKEKTQQTAEKARKVAATTAFLTALSLIIGAFIAAVSAVLGGKLTDDDENRGLELIR